jgi:hypothetical protein
MGSQLSCNQFYCQQTHFQPEWLSTHLYKISSTSNTNPTQYSLEKGKCNILESPPLSLYLTKKLSFDSSMQQFLLPLHFQIHSQIPISFYIFITPKPIPLHSIDSSFFDNSSFPKIAIHSLFCEDTIHIKYSHLPNLFKGKLKKNKSYYFPISFTLHENSLVIQHSLESSSSILSTFSSSIPLPFSFDSLHLTFYISSSLDFPSSSHFSFYLD